VRNDLFVDARSDRWLVNNTQELKPVESNGPNTYAKATLATTHTGPCTYGKERGVAGIEFPVYVVLATSHLYKPSVSKIQYQHTSFLGMRSWRAGFINNLSAGTNVITSKRRKTHNVVNCSCIKWYGKYFLGGYTPHRCYLCNCSIMFMSHGELEHIHILTL
jgi:hypothetical protein